MPYPDVAALIEDADARDAQQAMDSENLARILDRLEFLNNFGYVSGITDPEDPAVKRERAERERHGIKPPPMPIIAPVALRPPEITEEMVERYREAQKPYQIPEKSQPKSKLDLLNRSRAEAGR
jgi:type IV secretory pathway VirB10-like protein